MTSDDIIKDKAKPLAETVCRQKEHLYRLKTRLAAVGISPRRSNSRTSELLHGAEVDEMIRFTALRGDRCSAKFCKSQCQMALGGNYCCGRHSCQPIWNLEE